MRLFLFLILAAGTVLADPISIVGPKAGDTLYVGDTLFVGYAADSAYLTSSHGILIQVSVNNGMAWGELHPANKADLSINTVYPSDPSWGHVPVLIPDSVKLKAIGATFVLTVSDSVKFKVKDYSGSPYAVTGTLSIRPASAKPNSVSRYSRDNRADHKAGALFNYVNTHTIRVASEVTAVRFFCMDGRFARTVRPPQNGTVYLHGLPAIVVMQLVTGQGNPTGERIMVIP